LKGHSFTGCDTPLRVQGYGEGSKTEKRKNPARKPSLWQPVSSIHSDPGKGKSVPAPPRIIQLGFFEMIDFSSTSTGACNSHDAAEII
jgi:hypothetical protein